MIAELWRSERSWRLTALLTVVNACAGREEATGPLAPIDETWSLLVEAFRAHPDVTEDVLSRPQVGIWAAHTLARLEESSPTGPEPLWADVGYLHSLVAAIAVRAGVPFELDVPVRGGTAVLPTVGAATFPPGTTRARVRAADGRATLMAGDVTVPVGARDGWHPSITVTVDRHDVPLRVELLDRDTYRALRGPSQPRTIDRAEVSHWRRLLGDAWDVLVREQPDRARSIAQSFRMLAPEPAEERFRQHSASGAEAFGGMLVSVPDDAVQLAATLVHETQHHKLHALTHLLTLTLDDPSVRYYAPWRDDPRPVAGLLQGAYAFAGIAGFWRIHRRHASPTDAPLAHVEFALWRRQTHLVLRTLAGCGRLTEHGERFVATLVSEVEGYLGESVPVAERAAADAIADDHWAMWRSHNLRLSEPVAAGLSAAWRRGREPVIPPAEGGSDPPRAIVEPGRIWFDGRAVLTRYRHGAAAEFAALRADPARVGRQVAGATGADLDLVGGDPEAAALGYLDELARDPTSVHGWVGLGLAHSDPGGPVARALLGRPELVLTVARREGAADPLALAAWIGRALTDDDVREAGPAGWSVT
ncbi:HEXXH motif domain-containing protein [Virgisporangium ochraceum]|uniref:HEXXH motif domain-containing protein n=1 Tax=Virgisporangium ochraceum TaxID=65505 RepID=A0A8J4EJU5_9ACTN|nr:HEXXH motif domain-containing protein [Virgisporangium ochraceum]